MNGLFAAILNGQQSLGENMPYLINTEHGWIVGGNLKTTHERPRQQCLLVYVNPSIDLLIKRFWEIEDCEFFGNRQTKEEQECGSNFCKNVIVQSDGRLQVRLPFKEIPEKLGLSYDNAVWRFKCLESRLDRDDQLKQAYVYFIDEYIYMPLKPVASQNEPHYCIPHHYVLRPHSVTTKLRVVFDASAKTSSGKSLNELLMLGPTIQQDLIIKFLSFRLNRYALTGDIAKMYHQFVIDARDRRFQRIVWRPTKSEELKPYELNTVTYGMLAAPFLAIRGVHHIADLYAHDHPIGAVDDLLTGADSITELQHIKNDTVDILAQAGLHLTKFSSDCKEITKTSEDEVFIAMEYQDTTKTLLMTWMPRRDIFTFRYICDHQELFTKRSILSVVARMFDLLGFISPVIVRCKIPMQDLTLKGLDWNEPVDGQIKERWKQPLQDLKDLSNLQIRYVNTSKTYRCEIHGFADASERAYGYCLYVPSELPSGVKVT